jgi:hypothetical protein
MKKQSDTEKGEVEPLKTPNTVRDALLFDFVIGSFELRENHTEFLKGLIDLIRQPGHGPMTVSIDGFASHTGSAQFNRVLSENREQAVENFLRARTNLFDPGSPHKINRAFHGFSDSPPGENARFRSVRVVVHRPELPPPPIPVPKDEGSKAFQIKLPSVRMPLPRRKSH